MSDPPVVKWMRHVKVNKDCLLTVVIPVRNIEWKRLANCLKSINIQTLKKPEIIVSDHGSSDRNFKDLMIAVTPFPCSVLRYPTKETWSLSMARNIGIRRASCRYVVTLDADIILEPKVLETIVSLHEQHPDTLILSTVRNMKEGFSKIKLPEDYKKISESSYPPRPGIGGLMSADIKWWYYVRGFDERFCGWGGEDDDLRRRAVKTNKDIVYLQPLEIPQTKVFHQWHPKPYLVKSKQLTYQENTKLRKHNQKMYRAGGHLIRNDEKWGAYKP